MLRISLLTRELGFIASIVKKVIFYLVVSEKNFNFVALLTPVLWRGTHYTT